VLGICNCFAGGIFISIAFIHLLPEVASNYHEWVHGHEEPTFRHGDDEDEVFPLPYVLLFAGYALILFIDKVLFDSHGYFHDHGAHQHDHHDHSHEHKHEEKEDVSPSFVGVS